MLWDVLVYSGMFCLLAQSPVCLARHVSIVCKKGKWSKVPLPTSLNLRASWNGTAIALVGLNIWGFPKLKGTFWGSPYFGKLPFDA